MQKPKGWSELILIIPTTLMPNPKQTITLTEAEETLLITLYSRVQGCPKGVFDDAKGRQILESVDYDFEKLRVPTGTRLTVCLRARKFDKYASEFLSRHPTGRVVHLGCGLDARFNRVDNGTAQWYDLDLPEVVRLREKFYEEAERYHMISSSVTDLRWMQKIPREGGPVFVIAEGLFMYLTEEEVKLLVLALQERFPHCELAFDAFSKLTARNVKRHPSLRQTGAVVQWGIDDPAQIEQWGDGIRLREEWFFDQSEALERMSFGNRLMFRITRLFPVARNAHRILYYTL